jgi:hypothetical protein
MNDYRNLTVDDEVKIYEDILDTDEKSFLKQKYLV